MGLRSGLKLPFWYRRLLTARAFFTCAAVTGREHREELGLVGELLLVKNGEDGRDRNRLLPPPLFDWAISALLSLKQNLNCFLFSALDLLLIATNGLTSSIDSTAVSTSSRAT